jgi:hypothetical protein
MEDYKGFGHTPKSTVNEDRKIFSRRKMPEHNNTSQFESSTEKKPTPSTMNKKLPPWIKPNLRKPATKVTERSIDNNATKLRSEKYENYRKPGIPPARSRSTKRNIVNAETGQTIANIKKFQDDQEWSQDVAYSKNFEPKDELARKAAGNLERKLSPLDSGRGNATLQDLCQEDKVKIGQLMQKLAAEKEARLRVEREYEEKESKYNSKLWELKDDNKQLIQDSFQLQSKFQQSLTILKDIDSRGKSRETQHFQSIDQPYFDQSYDVRHSEKLPRQDQKAPNFHSKNQSQPKVHPYNQDRPVIPSGEQRTRSIISGGDHSRLLLRSKPTSPDQE